MQPATPAITEILFILLTFFLVIMTVITVRKKAEQSKTALRTFLVMFFWLLFLKIISAMEFFHDFVSLPPRLFIGALPCLIAIIILASSKAFGEFLRKIPLHWLVYIQSFRILMEIILYMLAKDGIIPERLSFEGLNFDILVGISALLVGWLVQKNKISKAGFITWNILGILLLLNITSLAALSTPYPFSIFKEEPLMTVIFYYPFVWLPGFVAPYALAMHVFSIKKVANGQWQGSGT